MYLSSCLYYISVSISEPTLQKPPGGGLVAAWRRARSACGLDYLRSCIRQHLLQPESSDLHHLNQGATMVSLIEAVNRLVQVGMSFAQLCLARRLPSFQRQQMFRVLKPAASNRHTIRLFCHSFCGFVLAHREISSELHDTKGALFLSGDTIALLSTPSQHYKH